MNRVFRSDLKIIGKLFNSETSQIFKLDNGSILKIYKPLILMIYKMMGMSLECKIMQAKPIKNVPEIIVPEIGVYDENNCFVGSIMKSAKGIDYNTYDDNLLITERCNLKKYANMHTKLESIVKRGNNEGIVFPDLCTCDNIYIDSYGNIQLIDYDGLQIGKFKAPTMSTSLGDSDQYLIPKYCKNGLFTPNLDKKSLIILYFLLTFNIDLNKIGIINPRDGKQITLEDIFDVINLQDNDIKHKVWKCFQPNVENDFLGSDVHRIADEYDMQVRPINGCYLKRLRKK